MPGALKKIVFNSAGFQAAAKDPKTLAAVVALANGVCRRAGDGFVVRGSIGKTRARAVVITNTVDAMRREAKDKVLTKAIGGR